MAVLIFINTSKKQKNHDYLMQNLHSLPEPFLCHFKGSVHLKSTPAG